MCRSFIVDVLILVFFMAIGIGVLKFIDTHNPFAVVDSYLGQSAGEKK